jgi:transposase
VGDVAGRDGLRLGDVVLAQAARLAGGGRLGGPAPGAAGAPARGGADRLAPRRAGQRQRAGEKGGALTGPNPTDRGKPGAKRDVATDARGTPLGLALSGANRHDSRMLVPTLDAIPPVRSGRPGRPRRRPDKLHADKAHDHRRCRRECRARGIAPRIARRGVESSERLGRHRWVVERTLAWLNRFRRLTVRYERRAGIHLAFTTLACALVRLNQIRRFC